MIIVNPSIKFLWMTPNPLQAIELAGRTCYKSEDKITSDSAEKFVRMLLDRGHDAMIEHASMSYRAICDRGITHEIVRHRLFSYAQESTRYCNYRKRGEISVIKPPFNYASTDSIWEIWRNLMQNCELTYNEMIDSGVKPELARSVLPTCLKSEIVITGNLREWMHFFELRIDRAAHPQMRQIAKMILLDATSRIKVVFDDYLEPAFAE